MAETINIPGLGPTKAVYVYAGGALVVGIVGYAWWKNSQSQPTDFVGADPDDYAVGDYDSPLGNTGGNSSGSFTSVDPAAIDTNSEWTQYAIEKMSNVGWEAGSVSAALGKYLSRQGLTEDEIRIVQTALAVAGPPPVGGPYPITNALPNPNPNNIPETATFSGGNHVLPWINKLNDQYPSLGLSETKLRSLNPSLPLAEANDAGFISGTNPKKPGQNIITVFRTNGTAKIR